MVFFKIRVRMLGVKLEAGDAGGKSEWNKEGMTLARMVQSEDKWPRSWPVRHLALPPPPRDPQHLTRTFKQTHKPVCPGTPRHEVLAKWAQVASQMFTSPTSHSSVCCPKPDHDRSQLGG